MTAAVATAAMLVGPGVSAGEANEGATRVTGAGGGATWGWHKVSHLPDGTRTFRTGYLIASHVDVRQGGEAWTEETIYAHTEDYTYDGDDRFVTRVNRLFAATRDDLTWTSSEDHTTYRITGTMAETVCDTWYEVCHETGRVPIDVGFAATEPVGVYDNDTFRPGRWQGDVSHVYSGFNTYGATAAGVIGSVSLPTTYAASYSESDVLVKRNCRDDCEYYLATTG